MSGRGGEMVRSAALGPKGELFLAGNTDSCDFPGATRAPRGQDAFLMKLFQR